MAGAAPLYCLRVGRDEDIRAFRHLGVDMAGPFFTKAGRGRPRNKRYLIVFSCCVTRAVNLEMSTDASARTFNLAFERHCDVFGIPETVTSNNGGNFQRTAEIMRQLQELWNGHRCPFGVQPVQTKWLFNPPYSPRWGGHYEIVVKSVKTAMEQVLGWPQILLDDEELATLWKKIQGYLNSRPLTELPNEASDGPPLTPGSFMLTGLPVLGTPALDGEGRYVPREGRRQLDLAIQEVQTRFQQEYLSQLQREGRKVHKSVQVDLGMLVYLLHPPLCCQRWPIGVVSGVHPGVDGQIRSVKVKTAAGELSKTRQDILVIPLLPPPDRFRLTKSRSPSRVPLKGCENQRDK